MLRNKHKEFEILNFWYKKLAVCYKKSHSCGQSLSAAFGVLQNPYLATKKEEPIHDAEQRKLFCQTDQDDKQSVPSQPHLPHFHQNYIRGD